MSQSDSPAPAAQTSPAGRDGGPSTTPHALPRAGTSVESQKTALGWTSSDRRVAMITGAAVVALSLVHWARLAGRGTPTVEIQRLDAAENRFQLDINDATWVEWMQLDGVGETLSRRIVEDRQRNGPFAGIDEIQRVRGIGPKTLEALRPWLMCADCGSLSATPDGDHR